MTRSAFERRVEFPPAESARPPKHVDQRNRISAPRLFSHGGESRCCGHCQSWAAPERSLRSRSAVARQSRRYGSEAGSPTPPPGSLIGDRTSSQCIDSAPEHGAPLVDRGEAEHVVAGSRVAHRGGGLGRVEVAGVEDRVVGNSSAKALARRIRDREISAREVMIAHIEQIEQINPTVNAIVSMLNPEVAIERANEADRQPCRWAPPWFAHRLQGPGGRGRLPEHAGLADLRRSISASRTRSSSSG